MPPKPAVGAEELHAWVADLNALEQEQLGEETREKDIAVYHDWLAAAQRKVAPGFSFDVMTPKKSQWAGLTC
ncbi:hypothetical protein JCM33374_g3117 [Metschnikowia sp. JCM 33374]|nr:hypothetical protein JCM33374_g3117 [Metschnikowia sp. JCM 33374]